MKGTAKMAEEDKDLYVPAGHLLMTSSGEYSDYSTGGCFVTLEPLYCSKLQELREQIIAEQVSAEALYNAAIEVWRELPQDAKTTFPDSPADKQGLFIAAMIRKGWLLSVAYTELHIGSYDDLDLSL
jgi:hypothetical protein